MKTVKLLWRPISVFFRRDLRLIPFVNTFPSSNPSLFLLSSSSSLHTHDFNLATKFPHIGCPNQLSKLFCSNSLSNHNKLRTCWNCQSSSTTSDLFLVCNSCHCIQPVDSTIDYFQIFGLERKYEIEESSLEGMYKSWQKKLHPDLVHSKSETEREYAAEQSARVIDAYRTLKNSLSRAMYLMKLQGVHVDEEKTVSDPELLAEVMEIRESVEEAPDSQALKQIQAEVQEKMKQWSETFSGAFKSQKTEEALNAIRRMTYYKRANEEIEKRL